MNSLPKTSTKEDDSEPSTLLPLILAFQGDIDNYMDALIAGDITPEEFEELMSKALALYNLGALRAGQGFDEVSQEARVRIDGAVALQLGYLVGFTAVLAAGLAGKKLADLTKRFRARAKSYSYSLRTSWADGDVIRQVGRVLPLPAMPAQGTQCGSNCKCKWRIVVLSKKDGDYDAYWERHSSDSCQTCVVRERLWSPTRIRGMQLQPMTGGGQLTTALKESAIDWEKMEHDTLHHKREPRIVSRTPHIATGIERGRESHGIITRDLSAGPSRWEGIDTIWGWGEAKGLGDDDE